MTSVVICADVVHIQSQKEEFMFVLFYVFRVRRHISL